MAYDTLFSVESLHSLSGASLAVLVVVQAIKNLPGLRRLPTQALAVLVSVLLMMTLGVPASPDQWAVLAVNGLLVSATSIGGWHIMAYSASNNGSVYDTKR